MGCMLPQARREIIKRIDRLDFGEVAIFKNREAKIAQRLIHNLNFGGIKEFVNITANKRFRTFYEGGWLFIVRTI